MSFQITILKVLAGHPEGRASLADLKHAMAILISSGSDWADRTKRLARAPLTSIFSVNRRRGRAVTSITPPALLNRKQAHQSRAKQDNAEYCYCQEGHRGKFVVFLHGAPLPCRPGQPSPVRRDQRIRRGCF